jgi:hypothetical protein
MEAGVTDRLWSLEDYGRDRGQMGSQKRWRQWMMATPLKGIRMDIDRKVIQLLPADGWRAQYEADPDRSSVTEETLLCWALVREGKEFLVVGVVVDGRETKFVDLDKRFIGYVCAD